MSPSSFQPALMLLIIIGTTFAAFASAQQQGSLVITGLVTYPPRTSPITAASFNVVQQTACSGISDLSQYSFAAYHSTQTTPYKTVASGNNNNGSPTSIAKGVSVYISQLSTSDFFSFFGFVPNHYLVLDLAFIGTDNLALRYQDTTIVDVYGVIGVDDSNTKADFGNGWTVRKSGAAASDTFNVSEWVIQTGAYTNLPSTNLQSDTPIVWITNYTCAPASAPARSPQPTLAERAGVQEEKGDHHRGQATDPPAVRATPAPVTVVSPPVVKPTPNPERKKPANTRRPRGSTPPPTNNPTKSDCRYRHLHGSVNADSQNRRFLMC